METKILATIQSSIILYGVSKGLGRSVELIDTAELRAVEKVDIPSDRFLSKTYEMVCLGRLCK